MISATPSHESTTHPSEQDASQAELVAQKLKACGDDLRVQILQCLRFDAFGVLELTQMFDTKQSGMSHHLKVLSKAGLVEAQREGNSIFYRRPVQRNQNVEAAVASKLFEIIDLLPIHKDVEQRIQAIRAQRTVQSEAFFARNAERFSEQQELICDHEQYAQTSLDLLSAKLEEQAQQVLEIGPGEGLFLSMLADRFEGVVAVDTSEKMLAKAQQHCQQKNLGNVELKLGSTSQLVEQAKTFDGIVMNMVLHHVPAPIQLFRECGQLLSTKGVLVVCDLSHHNQEWTRENCGDLWLGFESEELDGWASAAHFVKDESVYIGLRNGFQIQVHRYIKQ